MNIGQAMMNSVQRCLIRRGSTRTSGKRAVRLLYVEDVKQRAFGPMQAGRLRSQLSKATLQR